MVKNHFDKQAEDLYKLFLIVKINLTLKKNICNLFKNIELHTII
jgi:hypothetical protein